eukprot:2783044-Lingulodinium_polyedra.AAC.1
MCRRAGSFSARRRFAQEVDGHFSMMATNQRLTSSSRSLFACGLTGRVKYMTASASSLLIVGSTE